mmetsp:Transcript_19319/g.38955  ORF Transcript_19319/g.38955 Transcript_19319/m.38955 type:complete len:142 (+) Transcript_19319:96-521(+)
MKRAEEEDLKRIRRREEKRQWEEIERKMAEEAAEERKRVEEIERKKAEDTNKKRKRAVEKERGRAESDVAEMEMQKKNHDSQKTRTEFSFFNNWNPKLMKEAYKLLKMVVEQRQRRGRKPIDQMALMMVHIAMVYSGGWED